MFSWSSSTATKQRPSSTYPGRRISQSSNVNGTVVHRPVAGSIRPPQGHSRAEHLESYLSDATLQRSTRRVSSDDTTYDTVFQTTRGETLILRVNIPLTSSFASFCPAMTLAGVRVLHPWVEKVGRSMRIVGYEPIQSEAKWKESGLLLGQAVHAVVQHLQLNPPEILEITDKGLQAIQKRQNALNGHQRIPTNSPPRSGSSKHTNEAPPSYHAFQRQTNLAPPPDVPMPTIPKEFPELDSKTRGELDKLLEDGLEFVSLVHRLDTFREIQRVGASILNENVKIADENLKKESQLKSSYTEVKTLQEQLKSKVEAFQKLEAQQNELCAPPDPRVAIRRLNKANKQAFEESESFAEAWVDDGATNVDAFIKEFLEKRKVHHQRAAKLEILERRHKRLL